MTGSLSGHGAAWPLPTVTNAALHAALHRSDLNETEVHTHRRGVSGKYQNERDRRFGSLTTVGPFPVDEDGQWFFPRPLDANEAHSSLPTFAPLKDGFDSSFSSLPAPLCYPVANTMPPSKDTPSPWWSTHAWDAYINEGCAFSSPREFRDDSHFFAAEHSYGIGIDPETGTQDQVSFYSASYLRMKQGTRIGLLAEALDKGGRDAGDPHDLIKRVFPNSGSRTDLVIGGQQRLCSVERPSGEKLHLPTGLVLGFHSSEGKFHVKWTLLTPAIYPKKDKQGDQHSGGWLPSWVDPKSGDVRLLDGPGGNAAARKKLTPGKPIKARLVAAMVGKPLAVTGYAIAGETKGARVAHLAVPAGSVYYFECDSSTAAIALVGALNWHGGERGSDTIINRRSTLMGEKGFGIGVCTTWKFHPGERPSI